MPMASSELQLQLFAHMHAPRGNLEQVCCSTPCAVASGAPPSRPSSASIASWPQGTCMQEASATTCALLWIEGYMSNTSPHLL